MAKYEQFDEEAVARIRAGFSVQPSQPVMLPEFSDAEIAETERQLRVEMSTRWDNPQDVIQELIRTARELEERKVKIIVHPDDEAAVTMAIEELDMSWWTAVFSRDNVPRGRMIIFNPNAGGPAPDGPTRSMRAAMGLGYGAGVLSMHALRKDWDESDAEAMGESRAAGERDGQH